jgi:hypothetical protein
MLVAPASEWAAIATESPSVSRILLAYVTPLAALQSAAWTAGVLMFGLDFAFVRHGDDTPAPEALLRLAAATVIGWIGCVLVLAAAFTLIAPMFEVPRRFGRAVQVAAYGTTPLWLCSILLLMPMLVALMVVAAMHAFYLYFSGLQGVMAVRKRDAAEFVAIALVVSTAGTLLLGSIMGTIGLL